MKDIVNVVPLICGLMVIGATLTVYFLVTSEFSNWINIQKILFLLLAELIFTVKISRKSFFIMYSITYLTSLMHIGMVILLSAFQLNSIQFSIFNIVGLTILVIVDLSLVSFKNKEIKN